MMLIKILLNLLLFYLVSIKSSPVDSDVDAMTYLRKYGYVPPPDPFHGSLLSPDVLKHSIETFQLYAGIKMTGEMDNQTRKMMMNPRCGNPDIYGSGFAKRKRRYALLGGRWPQNQLTYRIREGSYSSRLRRDQVQAQIKEGFEWWSNVSNLEFTEAAPRTQPDIEIRFVIRGHNDGDPFDGRGGTLAHAFSPRFGGNAHFDDEEPWTTTRFNGVNLQLVAAHEFGHSLGLGHSDVQGALMAPFYNSSITRLHPDDIMGIQALYGTPVQKPNPYPTSSTTTRRTVPTTTTTTTTQTPPTGSCNGRFDAITQLRNRSTYAFVGTMFWRLSRNGPDPGFPQSIQDVWGVEGNIDAALSFSGYADLFKGRYVHRIFIGTNTPRITRKISELYNGVPTDVDAAFVWTRNGRIYFVKGNQYWQYNRYRRRVDPFYPRNLTDWRGLPSRIDAALRWENRNYFFSNGFYYRLNDRTRGVSNVPNQPYPRRSDEWWLGCIDPTLSRLFMNERNSYAEKKNVYESPTSKSITYSGQISLEENRGDGEKDNKICLDGTDSSCKGEASKPSFRHVFLLLLILSTFFFR